MNPEQAGSFLIAKVSVSREDIARAKSWIVRAKGSNVSGMGDEWLREQNIPDLRQVNTDSEDCEDTLTRIARAYSIRLAFYHAVWELITAGIVVASDPQGWWEPSLEYKTQHYAGGVPIASLAFPHPSKITRLAGCNEPADPDIFLDGIDCTTLHSGILEGIEQALVCFRRGLYMPATAMLAAATEATWTECGRAVAKNLSDQKLSAILSDPYVSIARLVSDVRKALEQKTAKPLLQKAGQTIHQVTDAEIWTTTLRDRRNALHWGKAKSFIADHAETGTLLMAAPQHLKTLEAIRASC
jgi:hypothetical protein